MSRHGGGALSVVDSYWDRETTETTTSTGSPNSDGLTSAELQAPAGYTGIYQQWDDYDLDGDGRVDADDDAWEFGHANQWPVLRWRGLPTADQFQGQLLRQTDTAPTFGDATVSNMNYAVGLPIVPFQLPAATGGNGAYDYTVTGLLVGLVFDEDGTGTCMAVRTVCGTPTASGATTMVTVTVNDADTNMASSDQASLTFTMTTIPDTVPTFGSATVSNKSYVGGRRIDPFRIPAATDGNGSLEYAVAGLPAGLVFDEDGTGDCLAARTVCGTPTALGTYAVTVTVNDDDQNMASSDQASLAFTITVAGSIVVSPRRLSLSEGGSSGAYTVALGSVPTGSVTVALTSDNPAVTVSPARLTFTTRNWATARTVRARAVGDADAVDELATINHTASRGGYAGVTATARVMVQDSEAKTGTDYDVDNDGLIEVDSLAGLNALRWDLDGDGAASSGNAASYAAVFATPTAGMGCPDGGDADQLPDACAGYELTDDLDFDTDGDGDVDSDDAFASWTPIAGYAAVLDGGGHAIANLKVTGAANDSGLFSTTAAGSTIRALGLVDASVSGGARVGALAGTLGGRAEAVYATGSVSGAYALGGLAGVVNTTGAIVSSYAMAEVACSHPAAWAGAGGLTSYTDGPIAASYSTSTIAGACQIKSGLVGSGGSGAVTASYWDAGISGIADDADSAMPEGLSTSAMWTPTAYGSSADDVYVLWDQDVDADGALDDPWDFGGAYNHPVLKWGGHDAADQRTDYDADGDGLLGISTLGQLNAVRWDLDGDGAASAGDEVAYYGPDGFFNGIVNASGVGFCPTTTADADDNDCLGYELLNDLDFDTDGDGATYSLLPGIGGTVVLLSDDDDAWHNGGAGWDPIGGTATPDEETHFRARFEGNGHVVDNLFINRNRNYSGLFAAFSDAAVVTSLGLPNARVGYGATVGILAGQNRGHVGAAWSSGQVTARTNVGGLIGGSSGTIVASYSAAAVDCTRNETYSSGGGLAAWNSGTIAASYSTGAVTGDCPSANKHGFVSSWGTVEASYWDEDLSGIDDDADADPPEGETTLALQTPTAYGADSDSATGLS